MNQQISKKESLREQRLVARALGQTRIDDCAGHVESNRIGEYTVLGVLAQGGMGTVFRGRHETLGRDVAIKVISGTPSSESLERFRQEIKSSGLLPTHPNVVFATDARECDGQLLLVMELVDGWDLRQLIRDLGCLDWREACALIHQAAKGLDHLHQSACVHRDVKPRNLMLTRCGTVKLLDLGLSRHDCDESHEITCDGHILGTPDFMSPEQWSDAKLADARSDIYSLGCTWYSLLAGHPPFAADGHSNWLEKRRAHCEELPDELPQPQRNMPRHLQSLLYRMLAKSPHERPQQACIVSNVLAEYTHDESISTLLDRFRKRPTQLDTSCSPTRHHDDISTSLVDSPTRTFP